MTSSTTAPTAIEITPERERAWMELAVAEALAGKAEGGDPIGSVLIGPHGEVLGRGRNRFKQTGVVSTHAETEAFADAAYRESYEGTTIVTTAEPCWYCSGLIRQFGVSRVVIGATTNMGAAAWLSDLGRDIRHIDDPRALELLAELRAGEPK